MKMSTIIPNPGRLIAFYPDLTPMFKSTNSNLLFCQLMYWTGKGKDPNGWIYKTSVELQAEIGLTKDQQETARSILREFGVLQEKKKGIPPRVHFRIKQDAAKEKWIAYVTKRGISRQFKSQKQAIRLHEKAPQQLTENPAYISESTANTTHRPTSYNAASKRINKNGGGFQGMGSILNDMYGSP